jgi:uncharacterized protein with HEPN domain
LGCAEAAERVARFTAGKVFADYERDDLLRSAVERQLEIVGDALGKLRRVDPATAASIRDIERIVGFRNIVVHGYATSMIASFGASSNPTCGLCGRTSTH